VKRRLVLLSILVGLAFALFIGIEAALAGNAASHRVTLTVSIAGTGFGEVFSQASHGTRIVCPTVCSGHFPVGTKVALHVDPDMGSEWTGHGGSALCERHPRVFPPWMGCLVTLTEDTSIDFTIMLKPHCGVPNAKGKTLAVAKKMIHSRNCKLGTVTHAASLTVGKGHVISLKPKPGTYLRYLAKVNLVVSRGRR
jgi:hypothetical protein